MFSKISVKKNMMCVSSSIFTLIELRGDTQVGEVFWVFLHSHSQCHIFQREGWAHIYTAGCWEANEANNASLTAVLGAARPLRAAVRKDAAAPQRPPDHQYRLSLKDHVLQQRDAAEVQC